MTFPVDSYVWLYVGDTRAGRARVMEHAVDAETSHERLEINVNGLITLERRAGEAWRVTYPDDVRGLRSPIHVTRAPAPQDPPRRRELRL